MNAPLPDHGGHEGRHEPLGVDVRLILRSALGLLVLIGSSLGLVWKFDRWLTHRAANPAVGGPREPAVAPVMPPLDTQQRAQRLLYEAAQQQQLSSYGWVDQQQQIAHIPIERAMELLPAQYQETP